MPSSPRGSLAGMPAFAFGSLPLFPPIIPLLDLLVIIYLDSNIQAFRLSLVKRHLCPSFSPFFFAGVLLRMTDQWQTEPLLHRSSLSPVHFLFAFAFALGRRTDNKLSRHAATCFFSARSVRVSFSLRCLYPRRSPSSRFHVKIVHYRLATHLHPRTSSPTLYSLRFFSRLLDP